MKGALYELLNSEHDKLRPLTYVPPIFTAAAPVEAVTNVVFLGNMDMMCRKRVYKAFGWSDMVRSGHISGSSSKLTDFPVPAHPVKKMLSPLRTNSRALVCCCKCELRIRCI